LPEELLRNDKKEKSGGNPSVDRAMP